LPCAIEVVQQFHILLAEKYAEGVLLLCFASTGTKYDGSNPFLLKEKKILVLRFSINKNHRLGFQFILRLTYPLLLSSPAGKAIRSSKKIKNGYE